MENIRVPTVIASALFWSWFDTVLFRPTLFLPFGGTTQLYEPYFVIALGLGALPLLIAAFKPRSIDPLLARRSSWVAVTAASVLGGMATAIGAWSSSLPLVVGGAVLVGSCLGCYQLLWARSYAAGGARSAVTLVSLSIVLGALLDFSIFGLPPIVGALLTIAMPFVSLLLVLMAPRLAAPSNEREPQRPTPPAEPNADTVNGMSAPQRTTPFDTLFEGSRHRLFGLPLALVLSFLVYGFSFG